MQKQVENWLVFNGFSIVINKNLITKLNVYELESLFKIPAYVFLRLHKSDRLQIPYEDIPF